MKFLNPYTFIPAAAPDPEKAVDYEGIHNDAPEARHLRHDRWERGTYSGRIVCKLTTKTPTLVGAKQAPGDKKNNTPTQVENYRNHGRLAIPGNSLRGAVGTIAETLSASSFRVLEDRTYSVRQSMTGSLKAIGMLEKDGQGRWLIRPLALTLVPCKADLDDKWKSIFGDVKNDLELRNQRVTAYIGTAKKKEGFKTSPGPDKHYVESVKTFQFVHRQQYFFLKRASRWKPRGDGPNTIELSHTFAPRDCLSECPKEQSRDCTRGVLYALGDERTLNDMPNNKKHALFVPFPENTPLPYIPINEQAIKDFSAIVEERRRATTGGKKGAVTKSGPDVLPYFPNGYGPRDAPFLRRGDLIYFDVEPASKENNVGTAPKSEWVANKIAYSAIWREPIPDSAHDFFAHNHSPSILPWGAAKRPGDAWLTPAEALFGVVEDSASGEREHPRNLASRIRFSDAILADPGEDEEHLLEGGVPFRPLGAPKPPSPAMYFRKQKAAGYIPKVTDANGPGLKAQQHQPNGRKLYRHYFLGSHEAPWRSNNDDKNHLKASGRPVKQEREFVFHVDFENLRPEEVALLFLSLEPGSEERTHKIGLGKPIGLGSVRIDVLGVFSVNRRSRYLSGGLEQRRYRLLTVPGTPKESAHWPAHARQWYHREWDTLSSEAELEPFEIPKSGLPLDPQAFKRINALNNPPESEQDLPINYPFSSANRQGLSNQTEGFKWFVNNDNRKIAVTDRQCLDTDNASRETLESNQKLPPKRS